MTRNGSGRTGRPRLIVRMSLRQAIPGKLLSSIARFRFAYRSHPKLKPPVRLPKISERLPSQNSSVSPLGFSSVLFLWPKTERIDTLGWETANARFPR